MSPSYILELFESVGPCQQGGGNLQVDSYPSYYKDGSVKKWGVSPIVTFQIARHFPLNRDYGSKRVISYFSSRQEKLRL